MRKADLGTHIVSLIPIHDGLYEVLTFEAKDGKVTNWHEVDGSTNLSVREAVSEFSRMTVKYTVSTDHSVYDCDSSNECSSCGLVFCDHYVHPDDDSSTCGWSEEDWHAFGM